MASFAVVLNSHLAQSHRRSELRQLSPHRPWPISSRATRHWTRRTKPGSVEGSTSSSQTAIGQMLRRSATNHPKRHTLKTVELFARADPSPLDTLNREGRSKRRFHLRGPDIRRDITYLAHHQERGAWRAQRSDILDVSRVLKLLQSVEAPTVNQSIELAQVRGIPTDVNDLELDCFGASRARVLDASSFDGRAGKVDAGRPIAQICQQRRQLAGSAPDVENGGTGRQPSRFRRFFDLPRKLVQMPRREKSLSRPLLLPIPPAAPSPGS